MHIIILEPQNEAVGSQYNNPMHAAHEELKE